MHESVFYVRETHLLILISPVDINFISRNVKSFYQVLVRETSLTSLAPSPSKQDKKVTFAKLLEKMSKEMSSSSSDMSCTEEKSPSRIFSFTARRSPRRSPRIRHTTRHGLGPTAGDGRNARK